MVADNYDNVCSCCGEQEIDPALFICERCLRVIKELEQKGNEEQSISIEQKENN